MTTNSNITRAVNNQDTNTTFEPTIAIYSELEHIVMSGSLALIMLVTLVGNATICLAVFRRRKLRTRTNMFIINLSCADIGVAVLCMPFSLITCLRHDWFLGDALCKLNGFLNIVFGLTSLLTLTAISIETYLAICKPLYHRHMSKRFALGLLIWTWAQPLVIASVPFFGVIKYEFKPGSTQCGVQFPTNLAQTIYAAVVILSGFVIPLCIMGFTYSNIFRSARRFTRRVSRVSFSSTSSTNSTTAHRQVAATVLILLVVFLMCWLPYFMYVVLVSTKKTLSNKRVVQNLGKAAYWCAFASSALNPYIYGFRNPQFRKEFQFILCWFCNCMGRDSRMRGFSTPTASRGSWDGSGFEYNHLRCPGSPCVTPKGRLYVDFAPLHKDALEKLEMLAIQAKLANCTNPGYCSEDGNGAFCSENGTSKENIISNNEKNNHDSEKNNNNNNSMDSNNINSVLNGTEFSSSQHGNVTEILTTETKLHHYTSEQESLADGRSGVKGTGSVNEGFVPENNAVNNMVPSTYNQEMTEIEISRSSVQADAPDGSDVARDLGSNLSEMLLIPARARGWSLRTLGARLKLGWIESNL